MSDQAKISLSGEIINIKDTVVIGSFSKRELWLKEVTGDYPQTYCIEFVQDKCAILDRYKIGDTVDININLRGRHWAKDGREGVMNTLQGWRIDLKAAATPGAHPAGRTPLPSTDQQPIYQQADAGDDLPF